MLTTTLWILPKRPKNSFRLSTSESAIRWDNPTTNTRFLCTTLQCNGQQCQHKPLKCGQKPNLAKNERRFKSVRFSLSVMDRTKPKFGCVRRATHLTFARCFLSCWAFCFLCASLFRLSRLILWSLQKTRQHVCWREAGKRKKGVQNLVQGRAGARRFAENQQ